MVPNLIKRITQSTGSGLLRGSAFFFISTTIVNVGNYLMNLILGRYLGPAAFADVSLMVTLMLVVSFVTAMLGLVTSKFTATYAAMNDLPRVSALRLWLGRAAWWIGIAMMLFLGLGAPFLKTFFNTVSVWPFVILSIGMPMYLAQAVDRGVLQGQTRFGLLAVSYQAEMWVRFVAAITLVLLGFAVNGAVAGLTLSFIATWLVARRVKNGLPRAGSLGQKERQETIAFVVPASAALLAQILINNSDILIVKHFFISETAGQYAALALIGRVVFFATWSVVTTLFPIVAQKHQLGEPHHHLLFLSLGIVAVISSAFVVFTLVSPVFIAQVLFGGAYVSIAPLLAPYAIATALYSMANVVINYRLSIGSSAGSAMAVAAGVAQVLGLWFFHSTLQEVVYVQIYIMAVLVLALLIWDLWLSRPMHPVAA